jgi:hypothetical protein
MSPVCTLGEGYGEGLGCKLIGTLSLNAIRAL